MLFRKCKERKRQKAEKTMLELVRLPMLTSDKLRESLSRFGINLHGNYFYDNDSAAVKKELINIYSLLYTFSENTCVLDLDARANHRIEFLKSKGFVKITKITCTLPALYDSYGILEQPRYEVSFKLCSLTDRGREYIKDYIHIKK